MNFKKALATYGGVDLLVKVIGLFSSPFTTRLLTISQFGTIPLLHSVWSVFALAQYGGADWAYPYFLTQKTSKEYHQRLIVTASTIALISVLIVWFMFGALAFSTEWLVAYANTSYYELALFILGILPTAIISWLCYILRFSHRANSYVRITPLGKVLPLVLVLPLLPLFKQDDRLLIFFGCSSLVGLLALVYALCEVRKEGIQPFAWNHFSLDISRKLIKYGFLLIPAGAIYALVAVSDRLMLGYFMGTDALAVYAIALSIGSVGAMLVSWFGLAFDPYLVNWIRWERIEYYVPKMQLLVSIISLVFGCLICLAALWTKPIILLIYPIEYQQSATLVPYVILAAFYTALSRIAVSTAMIAQTPRYYLILYASALIVNIIMGIVLINKIGILGAILGTVVAEFLIAIGWIYLGRVYLKNLPIRWGYAIVNSMLAIVFCVYITTVDQLLSTIDRIFYTCAVLSLLTLFFCSTVRLHGITKILNYLIK